MNIKKLEKIRDKIILFTRKYDMEHRDNKEILSEFLDEYAEELNGVSK